MKQSTKGIIALIGFAIVAAGALASAVLAVMRLVAIALVCGAVAVQ